MNPDDLTPDYMKRLREQLDSRSYTSLLGYYPMWVTTTSDNTARIETSPQRKIADEYRRAVEADMRRCEQEPWTVTKKVEKVAKPKVAKPQPEPEPKPFGHRDLILD